MKTRPRPLFPQRTKTEERLLQATCFILKCIALALLLTLATGKAPIKEPTPSRLPSPRSGTAPAAMGKADTFFAPVRFHKDEGFPRLVTTQDGKTTKVSSADMPAWCRKLETWAACHNAPFIIEFSKAVAPLNKDATKRERLFPDQPENWEYLDTHPARQAFLKVVADTTLGRMLITKTHQEIDALTEVQVLSEFLGVIQFASELSFRLTEAATVPGSMTSLFPDIFDAQTGVTYLGGAIHYLSGFLQLNQLVQKNAMDPQGTALQMKTALLNKIRAKSSERNTSVYDIAPFLDEVSPIVANICIKDPAAKTVIEQEVNSAIIDYVSLVAKEAGRSKSICTQESMSADRIYYSVSNNIQAYRKLSWQDLHVTIATTLLYEIPTRLPDGLVSKKRKEPEDNSHALNATVKKQKGHTKSAFEQGWTCEICGDKGHFSKNCTGKPNPKGPALAEKARQQAIAAREKREKQSAQRKRLKNNNASKDDEEQEVQPDASPAASGNNYKNNNATKSENSQVPKGPAHKQRAGAAKADTFEDRSDDEEWEYTTANLAVCAELERKNAFSNPLLILTTIACILGALICSMTADIGATSTLMATILLGLGIAAAASMIIPYIGIYSDDCVVTIAPPKESRERDAVHSDSYACIPLGKPSFMRSVYRQRRFFPQSNA